MHAHFRDWSWNDLLCRNLPTYWRANFDQSSIRTTDIRDNLPPWLCLRFLQLGGTSCYGFRVRLDNRRRNQCNFDPERLDGITCSDKTRRKVCFPKFMRCKGECCFSRFKFAIVTRLMQKTFGHTERTFKERQRFSDIGNVDDCVAEFHDSFCLDACKASDRYRANFLSLI